MIIRTGLRCEDAQNLLPSLYESWVASLVAGLVSCFCAAMPPKKRPVTADRDHDGPAAEDSGQRRASRVGYKDAGILATAISPFVTSRFFTNYPSDRAMSKLDKKKLLSESFG